MCLTQIYIRFVIVNTEIPQKWGLINLFDLVIWLIIHMFSFLQASIVVSPDEVGT